MSLISMLRSTITLQRHTTTKSAAGQPIKTWTADGSYTDVACDVQPASSSVMLRYMQRQLTVTHSVFLATDIAAKPDDRLAFGSRYFLIRGYRAGGSGYNEWPGVADVEEIVTP